jgi:hypothetical protein
MTFSSVYVHLQIVFAIGETPLRIFVAWKLFTVSHAIGNASFYGAI